jgi:class 3 adenylate cyclase/tetratricopeptide (TPR) repeat protein
MPVSSCAACGFTNPAGALYCGSCGQELGRPCPSCGTLVGEGLAFCTACGAALDGDEDTQPAEERKIVTVVFVDLVGFTDRAEKLDPEDVRGLLTPYHARAKTELERFGGTVEKFIGDAVVAVFGAPVSHEDDPERAVRAALAVRDAISELNASDPSLDLAVRVGAATGEALVNVNARPERGEALAAGDVLNTASRLQSGAAVNAVLVDEATRRSTGDAIEYENCDPVVAKGKAEPIPAWVAVAPRARLGVDIAFRGRAPLVGRNAELETLLAVLARAKRERAPQLVTLVGVPGIGKSRLIWELYSSLDANPQEYVRWRQGRSLSYGDGVPFWALGEMTKAHAGILETDGADSAVEKLSASVTSVITDESEARWVEAHLRPLAGLGAADEPGSDRGGEAFAAWRRFFEALAEQRPLILVFEDLHWADDGLLEFVDHLADWATDVPILIVCTARPELLDRRPGWGGGKRNATILSLAPLSEEETETLLSSLLTNGRLAGARRSELLARAGGNPLYAEEYARMDTHAGEELPLPDSVQGIVAARLDTLPPEEKGLVQVASIVGKVFWAGSLAAVSGLDAADIQRRLHALERKEFIRRERRSSVAGETAYVFRHALVRDVAYGQIPRGRRANLHRLAAAWIESLAADRPEDLADMVAHHYSTALELARAAGQEDGDLAERARTALREAGDRAASLNAFAAAARFYGEALGLTAPTDPERPRLLLAHGRALFYGEGAGAESLREAGEELVDAGDVEPASEAQLMLGELDWLAGRPDEGFRHFEGALHLLATDGPAPARTRALATLARFHTNVNQADEALRIGLEALAEAEALGLEELRAHALTTIGVARTMLGEPSGLDDLRRSIEIAETLNSAEIVRACSNLASMLVHEGRLAEAFDLYERGRHEARRFGDGRALLWLAVEAIYEAYWRGSEEAAAAADAFLADSSGTHALQEVGARLVRAHIQLEERDLDGALESSAQALDFARDARDPQNLFPAAAFRARVLAQCGEPREASALVRELEQLWSEHASEPPSFWTADLAFAVAELGQPLRVPREARSTPWLEAARAVADGRFADGARVYSEIGSVRDAETARRRSEAPA